MVEDLGISWTRRTMGMAFFFVVVPCSQLVVIAPPVTTQKILRSVAGQLLSLEGPGCKVDLQKTRSNDHQ